MYKQSDIEQMAATQNFDLGMIIYDMVQYGRSREAVKRGYHVLDDIRLISDTLDTCETNKEEEEIFKYFVDGLDFYMGWFDNYWEEYPKPDIGLDLDWSIQYQEMLTWLRQVTRAALEEALQGLIE